MHSINEKIIIVPSASLSEVFKYYNMNKTYKHIKYPSPVKMCYRSVHMWGLYMLLYSIQYDKNVWIKVYWHAGLVITVKFETASVWRLI